MIFQSIIHAKVYQCKIVDNDIHVQKGTEKDTTFHATCIGYIENIKTSSMVNLILRLYTQYWVTNASMYKYNSMY